MKKIEPMKEWKKLSDLAWSVRDNAYVFGGTKVGVSLISSKGNWYSGCNIEHHYRSHDIHAEICAISSMVSSGDRLIQKMIIVAERDFFTPCGSCMDWIVPFSNVDTIIGFQGVKDGEIQIFTPNELMSFYPK